MIKSKSCRHGQMTYLSNDVYIGRAYDSYGEHSEIEVQFLLSLVQPGDLVIDAGANIGAMTIPFAKKGCTVHAFEPQPKIYELLALNVRDNDLASTVVGHRIALGGKIGTTTLPKLDYDLENNFGGIWLADGLDGDSVEVTTIDFAVPTARPCALIKVDVEGMEGAVVEGARETIARWRPLLYVENQVAEKSAALIDLLGRMGYAMWWHLPPLFNPANFAGRSDNLFPGIVSVNMLCVPNERLEELREKTMPLRRVAGPHDSWTGSRPTNGVRPPSGWAGIVRFGGIGDNLIAASAVGALKRKGFKVEVITSVEAAWPVFEHNPNIDKLSIKTKSEIPTDMLAWQKFFKGRSDEYDVFAHLSHSCEGLLALFPGSTQFWWPAHWRRKHCGRNYLETVHDIAGCGYDFGPLFYASDAEKAHALETKKKVGERVVAMCLSGTRRDKRHPRLPLAVSRIIKELGVPVVAIGSHERDFESAKAMQQFVRDANGTDEGYHVAISSKPDENGNRAIDWPIRRTIAFAQACDLVIGPDTGVMWGVAFEPMPKIVMLGHASPENITKHWIDTVTLTPDQARVPCWPCHQLHDEESTCTPNADNTGAACISDVSIERIVETTREILSR